MLRKNCPLFSNHAKKREKTVENKVEDIEKKLGIYGEVNVKEKSSGRELKIMRVDQLNI
ncbi:hypothetical protein M997_1587 [Proteus hauseri ATCC 700826]|uniref:Uncharacterized protein n=1 Tax=Proteus hauseri ATCC 700826 TaxID=1354271 RepID=A0AAJ3LTR3_PROHU|nr:hypothetical protein M997_1587 [Proteus hauseri ATCC 700826]